MHMIDTTYIRYAQAQIDTQIDALGAQLQKLREARNNVSAVSHLPAEILVKIFLDYRKLLSNLASSEEAHLAPEWLIITMVSRRWRIIAINAPELWTDVSFSYSKKWIAETIKRAKAAPLSIMSGLVGDHNYLEKMPIVFPREMHRMQSVDVHLFDYGEGYIQEFSSHLINPAPLLKRLQIVYYFGRHRDRNHCIIPGNALGGTRLDLESLQLEGCKFQSETITRWVGSSLTSLILTSPGTKLSPIALLQLLEQAHDLVQLFLDRPIDGRVDSPHQLPEVHLRSLKSLTYRPADVRAELDVISHIHFPHACTITFEQLPRRPAIIPVDAELFSQVIGLLSSKILTSLSKCRSMTLCVDGLVLLRFDDNVEKDFWAPGNRLLISLVYEVQAELICDACVARFVALPLNNIEVATIRLDTLWSDALASYLGNTAKIRSLVAWDLVGLQILRSFSDHWLNPQRNEAEDGPGGPSCSKETLAFSSLRELRLVAVAIVESDERAWREALIARNMHLPPLDALYLNGCSLTPETILDSWVEMGVVQKIKKSRYKQG